MSETVHVHYVIGDTVLEETHTADKVTFQHWPDGRAQIRLHNNGRITDWIAYHHAHRIHRTNRDGATATADDKQTATATCSWCGDGMFPVTEMEDGLCQTCASTPEDKRGMVGP